MNNLQLFTSCIACESGNIEKINPTLINIVPNAATIHGSEAGMFSTIFIVTYSDASKVIRPVIGMARNDYRYPFLRALKRSTTITNADAKNPPPVSFIKAKIRI